MTSTKEINIGNITFAKYRMSRQMQEYQKRLELAKAAVQSEQVHDRAGYKLFLTYNIPSAWKGRKLFVQIRCFPTLLKDIKER